MLSPAIIEDLVNLRLPEAQVRATLLELTPDRIDLAAIDNLLTAISHTVTDEAATLSDLGADAIDCAGTGGSGLSRFNTSTAAAFVLAAGGARVVKCGNVGISGRSGSFDFLGSLGFPSIMPVELLQELYAEHGLIFIFVPQFYPALQALGPARRLLGVRTAFNLIGPMLNPARPSYRLYGVSCSQGQSLISSYLCQSESIKKALVVRGEDGLDEVTHPGTTELFSIAPQNIRKESFHSPANGLSPLPQEPLTAEANAAAFLAIVAGEDTMSAHYHQLCLNAGAGFLAAEKVGCIEEGARLAAELLSSGAVREKFQNLRRSYGNRVG